MAVSLMTGQAQSVSSVQHGIPERTPSGNGGEFAAEANGIDACCSDPASSCQNSCAKSFEAAEPTPRCPPIQLTAPAPGLRSSFALYSSQRKHTIASATDMRYYENIDSKSRSHLSNLVEEVIRPSAAGRGLDLLSRKCV